jgi:hypothetical protein
MWGAFLLGSAAKCQGYLQKTLRKFSRMISAGPSAKILKRSHSLAARIRKEMTRLRRAVAELRRGKRSTNVEGMTKLK